MTRTEWSWFWFINPKKTATKPNKLIQRFLSFSASAGVVTGSVQQLCLYTPLFLTGWAYAKQIPVLSLSQVEMDSASWGKLDICFLSFHCSHRAAISWSHDTLLVKQPLTLLPWWKSVPIDKTLYLDASVVSLHWGTVSVASLKQTFLYYRTL